MLALYSDDLVELRGSVSAVETEVTNLFAIASQAHVDSGTRVRLRVAKLLRIGIDPSWTNDEALAAITDNTVRSVDVHRMRDDTAADLVALLRPHRSGDSCGVAWLVGAGLAPVSVEADARHGFSVTDVTPCGTLVLAHEIGHNLGSLHDHEAELETGVENFGAYRYSYGYRRTREPGFATVMAYNRGVPWLGYFSNPLSQRCGAPCGEEGRADNVRGFNATGPVVAAFRNPPGTLSIIDAEIHEPDPGGTRTLVFPVRLAGTAPAGGVRFDVVVTGGTARAGIDYRPPDRSTHLIPQGERETGVAIEVVGDAVIEPDETRLVRLANVAGARLHQGEAVGTILNDDPRTMLSGRVRFSGASAPGSAFPMTIVGADGNRRPMVVELTPPAFAYSVPVVRGASVELQAHPPAPFAALPLVVEKVEAPTARDITLRTGRRVSGRLTWPAGQPAPASPLDLTIKVWSDGHEQVLPISLGPPDFRYTAWVAPGTRLYFEATPPAPWQRFLAIHRSVDVDLVQDIPLSTLPGLVLWGGGRTVVADVVMGMTDFVAELSAPAPRGGVRMRYRTVDGTARAGIHYTPAEGTFEIPEGQTRAPAGMVAWSGTAVAGEKDFEVVVTNVVGATPTVDRIRIVLVERDRQMSDPLPPRVRR